MSGDVLPLCPGGRCGAVLTAAVGWRDRYRIEFAERSGRLVAGVFRAAIRDADLPYEMEMALMDAFAVRMLRIQSGESTLAAESELLERVE